MPRSCQTRLSPLLGVSVAAVALLACGPLGPLPGGTLRGPIHEGPTPGWADIAAVEQIQIETRPSDPYSVNVWMGVHGGSLYVPTSLILGADDPTERAWVRNVLDDPNVRLRIDGTVYPLRAVKVEDPNEVATVRAMLLEKYDVEVDEHVEQGWIFRMDPR